MAIARILNTVSAANATSFSASMWVIPPADNSNTGDGSRARLTTIETNDANLNGRLHIYLNTGSSRRVFFSISNFVTGDPDLNKTWAASTSANAYTPGLWHHLFICAKTDTTTSGYCFVNTVNVTSYIFPGNNTGFTVPFNGCLFGLPTTSSLAPFQTTSIQMAEVQIWLGTFIDPTVAANLEKFVQIVNSVGKPQNPSLASAAFGTPTYSFRGNNSTFPTNRGNGGSMTSSGTINTYTPAPG